MNNKPKSIAPPKPSGVFIPDNAHYPDWARKLDKTVYDLVIKLQDYSPQPIKVTSGYRTPEHNRKIGGVSKSAHCQGLAVDIETVDDRQRYWICRFITEHAICRYGLYTRHVHFDISHSLPQNVVWVSSKA